MNNIVMERKTKILIADDEPINLDFFDVMLSKLGFTVEKAEDGVEALEKIKKGKPDIIILDNIMPKLSGWKVTRLLKTDNDYKEYRDIPIIMFSAMDDVKDKIEGYELGVEDYIIKPFNFSEVLARIRAVLRNRELLKQVSFKEQKIVLVESLNKSLIYFTRHFKQPVIDFQNAAKDLDYENRKEVEKFVNLTLTKTEEILAALNGLEDEINEIENEEKKNHGEITLQDLESKFQKHFSELKERENNFKEVTP